MLLTHLAVASMAVSVVIVNARVWTGDARRPWADAIAVEGERLRAVGSSAEVMKVAAGARVIDAKGAMVVAGSGATAAAADESPRGVLRAGSLADLVMIDRDLTRVAPETIADAKVLLTMVGGTVVFER
jgi:predicted amidohydrolase YtcJ